MNLKVQLPKKLPNIHFTKKRAAILCCAVLIGASGVVYALKVSGSSNEVIYTPYTLDTGSITTSISGSGTLTAAKTYTLTANVKGEVLSDDFEIGDSVSEGQVLYELDNSDAVEELNNTSLSLKQQQLTTQQAQTALTNLTITAPLSGLVSEVYVKVGESVNSGTKIAEIVNNEDCTLRLQFNASDIDSIKINDTAAVYLLSSGETVSGTVSKINSGAYYNSANAYVSDVEISFTNPGGITELDSAAAIVNGIAGNNEGSISFNSSATLTAKTSGEITALNIDTNEISKALGRGKHTTRHVELLKMYDGYVADTPGFSSLELMMEPIDVAHSFHDFKELSQTCKFRGCLHDSEPHCAVKQAVEDGLISKERYEHYLMFLKESKVLKERKYG